MQSKAKDVKTYIAEAPAERREALAKLRELCLKVLKGFDESMDYGGAMLFPQRRGRSRLCQPEALHRALHPASGCPGDATHGSDRHRRWQRLYSLHKAQQD